MCTRSVKQAVNNVFIKAGRKGWVGCHISHTYSNGVCLYFHFASTRGDKVRSYFIMMHKPWEQTYGGPLMFFYLVYAFIALLFFYFLSLCIDLDKLSVCVFCLFVFGVKNRALLFVAFTNPFACSFSFFFLHSFPGIEFVPGGEDGCD